jgi:hypothetical protein
MDKKQPGRPKLYDSSSEKLEAFRKRLESAGLMRKELLVTQETWDQVTTLAKENGVSVSDAASGLLEYGTRAFMAKRSAPSARYSLREAEPKAIPEPRPVKPKGRVGANPIAEFFAKRKELAQSSSQEAPDTDQQ